jgi:outer membrane protein TolC
MARQAVSEIQYKPRVNLFVDGGLRTNQYNSTTFKNMGMSAGVTFAWTIFDGKQRHITRNQTKAELNTVAINRDNFILQNDLRKSQYLSELKGYDERTGILQKQLSSYYQVLGDYNKEIQKGQLSVINYITVLKNRSQAVENYYLLQANRLLLINAYNYYNW